MPTRWRRSFRYTRRTLGYGVLVLLILAAVLVSAANLLLPMVEDNPARVQAWLSKQVGQPVSFDRSETRWTRRGPRISLTGLKVGSGEAAVEIARAELLVAVYSGLLPDHPLTELKAKDLKLRLEQQPDDSWRLLGVPHRADSRTDALDVLSGFGELQVERSSLAVQAKGRAPTVFPRVDMRLRVQGERLRLGLRAEAKRGAAPLLLVADLDRREMSGRVWLGGERLQPAHWLAMMPEWRVPPLSSRSRVDLWAEVERRRVMRVRGRLQTEALALDSAPMRAFGLGRETLYDRIDADWLWQRERAGWSLQVPAVVFRKGRVSERIENLRLRSDGRRWHARVDGVALRPLSAVMPLGKGRLPRLEEWSQRVGLDGALTGIDAVGDTGSGRWRASGIARGVGFNPIGKAPGLRGVHAAFVVDERGGSLRFRPDAVAVDWPMAFGEPVDSRFDGSLAWWRSGPDWVIGSHGLRWRGEGMDLDLDAQLQFMPGRKAPLLNLAARLAPFDFAVAKRFWPRHVMSKTSIAWLDMALEKGSVRDGHVLIAGDLADWPFAAKAGRFQATATVQAERFKFNRDWPAAENAVIPVDFNGPGFAAVGRAVFLGNPVEIRPSGIAAFKESELRVDVRTRSDFARLLPVLRDTPLKDRVGPAVLALQGRGPVDADVRMFFPLKQGVAGNRIEGDIDFRGAAVRAPEWKLQLQDARGRARFDNGGFRAEQLAGRMLGQPVRLDLRVGDGHVRAAGNRVEALLAGEFPADTLLAYDAALADLRLVLKGRSAWRFAVSVPKVPEGDEPPVWLEAQSNLAGTAVLLPTPLAKPAGESTAFSMRTRLPVEQGVLEFRLGPEFRLLLKKPKNRPMAGIALFGAQTQGALPVSGISVRGTAAEFDVPAWLALAKKAVGGQGLQGFDLAVSRFRLLGNDFGAVRLQKMPGDGVLNMRASGARLDGSLSVPDAKGAAISARFGKVHFNGFGVPGKPATADTALDLGDPAQLPPVNVLIDDLRFGELDLGRAELQTAPSAQGLQVRRLNTRSAALSIDAGGQWQRISGRDRTALQADVSSPDLGKLLTAMRYAGVIKRGKSRAEFNGYWDGAPVDFSLAAFRGSMALDIRDGQILGVDPGGGRVLGLISLAELPRRLTLDFRDFFNKGMAFSSIKGRFDFAQGKADTRNLLIDAPAADIRITGSTDLVKEQFDQRVRVEPKAGGLLPVIGAVTAGPIGAAAGVVVQAVLDKPLKQGSAIEYRIRGPWAEPEVLKVEEGKP